MVGGKDREGNWVENSVLKTAVLKTADIETSAGVQVGPILSEQTILSILSPQSSLGLEVLNGSQ